MSSLMEQQPSMYKTILVTLDGTATDRAIIKHIKQLAKLAGSRIVLLHVADGWAARAYGPDAISQEITDDKAYLQRIRAELQAEGIPTDAELAYGDPAREIERSSVLEGHGVSPLTWGDCDGGRG